MKVKYYLLIMSALILLSSCANNPEKIMTSIEDVDKGMRIWIAPKYLEVDEEKYKYIYFCRDQSFKVNGCL